MLTDIDMVMFIEYSTRWSESMFKQVRASQQQIYASYNPSKLSSYLMYYDVNNLYGWVMCQLLPCADFRWIDDVQSFDFTTIAIRFGNRLYSRSRREVPQYLHDAHFTDLSFYQMREKSPNKCDDKLLATLYDKQLRHYIIITCSSVLVTVSVS